MLMWRLAAIGALLAGAVGGAAAGQSPGWTAQPWLEDLAQIRSTLETKYANLEWLQTESEVVLEALFARTERAMYNASSDAEARALLDRLVQRIGDGHVTLDWRRPSRPAEATDASPAASPPIPPSAEQLCRSIGYDVTPSPGIAPAVAGYTPMAEGDLFPAGTADVGEARLGFLRIGVFMPQGSPSLCPEAVAALDIPVDRPCDDECQNRIITHAYRALGQAMMDRIAALRGAGAEILVVDITGNGGGSEWAEAAARMLSPRPLQSARLAVVRGEHWARLWREAGERFRAFAAEAAEPDRAGLLAWAAEADVIRSEAERRCPPGDDECPWLVPAGYSTGLVGRLPAGALAGKDWGVHVFNPAQHYYRDGIWDGPAIVLTDQETWSAAEQFAALLQDNRAALIVGERTGGAGCGYSWGGTPTTLAHSGAVLRVPDCARLRADGSNEVRGILPDLVIPWRANDGRAFRARLLQQALPEAVERSQRLHAAAASSDAIIVTGSDLCSDEEPTAIHGPRQRFEGVMFSFVDGILFTPCGQGGPCDARTHGASLDLVWRGHQPVLERVWDGWGHYRLAFEGRQGRRDTAGSCRLGSTEVYEIDRVLSVSKIDER